MDATSKLNSRLAVGLAVAAGPLLAVAMAVGFPLVGLYANETAIEPFVSHLLFDLLFLASIISYLVAIWLLPSRASGWLRWLLIAAPLVSAAAMLFVYPLTSSDIYDYAARGRITVAYAGNPFHNFPSQYPGDPVISYAAWQYQRMHYGPLWEVLAGGIGWLAGSSLLANLLGYKLLGLAATLACSGLVVLLARQIGVDPLRGYYLFAANPLLLFEAVANAHNDSVMVALLLLSYLLLLRGVIWLAVPALIAAALIKFVPLLLVPFGLIYLWRRFGARMWGGLAVGLGMGLGLAAGCYAQFWTGWGDLLPLAEQGRLFINSFAAVGVLLAWQQGADLDQVRSLGAVIMLLLTLALLAWQSWRCWRAQGNHDYALLDHSADFLLLWQVFTLAWWQPWYLLWLLPLLALRPGAGRTIVLAACLLASWITYAAYTFDKGKVVGEAGHENLMALIIFPAVLVALHWRVWGRKRWLATQEAAHVR